MKTKLFLSIILLTAFSYSLSQSGFLSKNFHVWGVIINGTSQFHVDREGNFLLSGSFEDSVFLDVDQEWIVPTDSIDSFIVKFNPLVLLLFNNHCQNQFSTTSFLLQS